MTYRAMALGTMVTAALFAPAAAHAQDAAGKGDRSGGYIEKVEPRPREHERVLFNVGIGFVPAFGQQYTDEAMARLRNGSTARVSIDYDLRHAFDLEVGAIVMLNRSWGAGLTVLKPRFEHGEITTTVGTAASEFADGTRKETAATLELTRVLVRREGQRDPFDPDTDRGTGYVVRVLGGPVWYRAEQDVFMFRPAGGLEEIKQEGTGWGYHAGIDVGMYTSIPGLGGGGVGFGATFRYARGSVKLPGLEEPANRPAGGFNTAFTIRFRL